MAFRKIGRPYWILGKVHNFHIDRSCVFFIITVQRKYPEGYIILPQVSVISVIASSEVWELLGKLGTNLFLPCSYIYAFQKISTAVRIVTKFYQSCLLSKSVLTKCFSEFVTIMILLTKPVQIGESINLKTFPNFPHVLMSYFIRS